MAQTRQGVHGQLVVANKRKRPNILNPDLKIVKSAMPIADCPFCPGNEKMTPRELDRIAGKDGKWQVRVFHNKGPTFTLENSKVENTHWLIIPNPDHKLTYSQLSVDNLFNYFSMIRKAVRKMEENELVKWVDVFANEGYLSGMTVEHFHTQVLGWDRIPPKMQGLMMHADAVLEPCGFCTDAGKHKNLIIAKNKYFLAFVPYDAQRYYQVQIIGPHISSIAKMPLDLLRSLSGFFKEVLGAVNKATNFSAYNMNIFSGPKGYESFHFHIEILPHIARYGGFEHTSGVVQLNISPEEMASDLRKALVKKN